MHTCDNKGRSDSAEIRLTELKCTEIWSEKVPELSHLGPIHFGSKSSDPGVWVLLTRKKGDNYEIKH